MALTLFGLLFLGLHLSRVIPACDTLYPLVISFFLFVYALQLKNRNISSWLLLLVWFSLSVCFGSGAFNSRADIMARIHEGLPMSLEGKVINPPTHRFGHLSFSLKASGFFYENKCLKTRDSFYVRLKTPRPDSIRKDDIIKFSGHFIPLDTEKYFDQYLALNAVKGRINVSSGQFELVSRKEKGLIVKIRERLLNALNMTGIDSTTRDIFLGILFGEKVGLANELKQCFINMNVFHIFSVSGLHFGIIGAIFSWIFGLCGFGKPLRNYVSVPFLFAFLGMLDFPPAAFRSWLMLSLYWLAPAFGRKADGMVICSVSGIMLLLFNPWNCIDPGFILSYVAVISLLGPGRRLDLFFKKRFAVIEERYRMDEDLSWKIKLIKSGASAVIYSFAAWMGTFPLINYYFRVFSLISIFSNLIAIVIIPVILVCIMLTVFLGQFSFLVAEAYSQVASLFLNIMITLYTWMEKIPYAFFTIDSFSVRDMLWCYAGLGALYLAFIFTSREKQETWS